MVVARKSAVSARGTWFRQDSTPPLGKGSSAASEISTIGVAAPTRRQRRSRKNLSVSPPNSVQESSQQLVLNLHGRATSASGFTPAWLLRLYAFNRYSSVTAFLFVVVTLIVYGGTVYYQEIWGQGYRQLQGLQRRERELATANATLTSKMAEEAEQPIAGLVSPTPAGTIFLLRADHSPHQRSSTTATNSEQQQTPLPLGY